MKHIRTLGGWVSVPSQPKAELSLRKMLGLCNCPMCLRHQRVSREQAHARYAEGSGARAQGVTSPSATGAGLKS